MGTHGNFKSCSFCNLFSAIESMMQELKGDHEKKANHDIQDNVLNKDLVQPLEVQRVNAALPKLSLDMKREQIKETKQDVVYECVKNDDVSNFSSFLLGSVKQEILNDGQFLINYKTRDHDNCDMYNENNSQFNSDKHTNDGNGIRLTSTENKIGTDDKTIANEVSCYEDINYNNFSLKRMESSKVESDINHSITDLKTSKLSETENVSDSVQLEEKESKENVIWNNFQIRNDIRNGGECNHCRKVLKSTDGTTTTSLINHLKRKHPETLGIQISPQQLGIQSNKQNEDTKQLEQLYKEEKHKEQFGAQLNKKNKLHEVQLEEDVLHPQIQQKINSSFETLMKDHFMPKSNSKAYMVCRYCATQISNSKCMTGKMIKHLKTKHPREMEIYLDAKKTQISPEERTCKYCEKLFSKRSSMTHHIRTVHLKSKSFTCDLCGKHFSIKNSLDIHLITHDEEKPFKCIYCPKSFIRKYRKDAHEKSHNNIFDHACDYCSKAFISKQRKIHHERIHTGDKPYLCTNCGKAFRLRSHFVTHLRIHTEEKPYHCKHCDKNYRHLSSYRDHRCA